MASLQVRYLGGYDPFTVQELINEVEDGGGLAIARGLLNDSTGDNGEGVIYFLDNSDATTVRKVIVTNYDELEEELKEFEPALKVEFDRVLQKVGDGDYQELFKVIEGTYDTNEDVLRKAQVLIGALLYAAEDGVLSFPIT